MFPRPLSPPSSAFPGAYFYVTAAAAAGARGVGGWDKRGRNLEGRWGQAKRLRQKTTTQPSDDNRSSRRTTTKFRPSASKSAVRYAPRWDLQKREFIFAISLSTLQTRNFFSTAFAIDTVASEVCTVVVVLQQRYKP